MLGPPRPLAGVQLPRGITRRARHVRSIFAARCRSPPALPPQWPAIPPLALRDIDVKTLAHLTTLLRERPN
jgi:hypothetical protein